MMQKLKIGVLGAGVEGLAAAAYLVNYGYEDVVLFDEKAKDEDLRAALTAEMAGGRAGEVRIVTGADAFRLAIEGEQARELLFRSPGIHAARLEEARKKGIKVTSTTQYFFMNCPCPIIGITGTKGKGTTSTLIYEILKAAGKDVYLGGNIGESPLNFLQKLGKDSLVVLELSSFQLQDMTMSPQIAVVLRVTSDHMDYHRDREEYIEAKSAIVRFQKPEDICIVNADYDYAERYLTLSAGKKFFVSRRGHVDNGAFLSVSDEGKLIFCKDGGLCEEIGDAGKVGLLGAHNLENILPAITVGRLLGVSTETIRKVIYGFTGLPNRLEFVREVRGVKYYNDSFSTTPETSISASYAFKGPVILIAGGSEKFSDYTEWGKELQKNPKLKAVVLHGVTAERMEKALKEAAESMKKEGDAHGVEDAGGLRVKDFPLKVYREADLKDSLKKASEMAITGDNVVMSPAAASFDQFKNYKERGQKFREWAGEL